MADILYFLYGTWSQHVSQPAEVGMMTWAGEEGSSILGLRLHPIIKLIHCKDELKREDVVLAPCC